MAECTARIGRQRRELPWVRVEKDYHLDTDDGTRTLAELFDGRNQLLVYHFMFGSSYAAGCPTCSSIADSVNGVLPHLNARDVTMLFVSQAPLETLQAFKRRMGWSFPWVSSANSEFNTDLGFSSSQEQTRGWAAPMLGQLPPIAARNARETGTDVVGYLTESFGFSVFVLDDRAVYQTYSAGARGVEFLMGYYAILDRAPKGRDEGDGSSCGSAATTNTTASDPPWRTVMTNPASGDGSDYNAKIIKEFRANQGRVGGPWADTTLILIHHIGARSGVERVTPLGCFPQPEGRFVIVASSGGSPTHPDWYYNLKANPRITVEVGAQTFTVLADELAGAARVELWPKLVAEHPTLGEHQAKTTRQFPVFMLTRQD